MKKTISKKIDFDGMEDVIENFPNWEVNAKLIKRAAIENIYSPYI